MSKTAGAPAIDIQRAIVLVRGQRVMLDADLAVIYGVPTRVLIQAVTRNAARFPDDFMLRLNRVEVDILRSQSVISRSKRGWGGRRHAPYAFTEQGVAMLSSVLRTRRAIKANIAIMRTFVRLRQMLLSHEELGRRLSALEKKYDAHFRVVFDAIRELMSPPSAPQVEIGFRPRPRIDSMPSDRGTRKSRPLALTPAAPAAPPPDRPARRGTGRRARRRARGGRTRA